MQTRGGDGTYARRILIVEPDDSSRRILELTLRHAGFSVAAAPDGDEALRQLGEPVDLLIVAGDSPPLVELARQAKQSDRGGRAPAVIMILPADLDSRRRGLEAGADDFLTRPVYVQDAVTRSRALLQRAERERLERAARSAERFSSVLEDMPLVDLLAVIAAEQKSGVVAVTSPDGGRGEIFFRQGRAVDAEVGRLSGRDAVYRLFCWPAGRVDIEWKSIRRKDVVDRPPQELLMDSLRRVDEWRRLVAEMPPLDSIFEVDYRLLAERLADIPDDVNRMLRLFDGTRTLMQVVDASGLPDVDAIAAVGKLLRERIIHDVRVRTDDLRDLASTLGAEPGPWLSDGPGPFRSPEPIDQLPLNGATAANGNGAAQPTMPLDRAIEDDVDPETVLDDEAQSRFTARLQADSGEGEGIGPDSAPDVAAAMALPASATPPTEVLPGPPLVGVPQSDSGPTDDPRPTTLPGVGEGPPTQLGRPGGAGGDVVTAAPASDPLERTLQGVPPAPTLPVAPAPGTSPVTAPLSLDSSNERRAASGEILVVRPPAKPRVAEPAENELAHLPDERPEAFVRSGHAAAAIGSARALDEPPPVSEPAPDDRASWAHPRGRGAEKPAIVDFSHAEAAEELGVPSRARGALLVFGALAIIVGGGWVGLRVWHASGGASGEDQSHTESHAQAPASAPATAAADSRGGEAPAAPPPPHASAAAVASANASTAPPVPPATDDSDERLADPKLARTRAGEAATLLGACRKAYADGRMKDAEAACFAARDANPDSADAHALLAQALFNRSRRREALGAAEKALKLNPSWAEAYVIIGGVHQDAGEKGEAKRAYQRYLELDPHGQYAADLRAIVTKL